MVRIIKIEEADWLDVVGTDDYKGSSFGQDGINGIISRAELLSDNKIRLSSPRTGHVNPYFTEKIGNNAAGDWSDVDLFGVRLQKDDRITIDVDSFDDDGRGNVNDPIDTMIRVFNRGGNELARAGTGTDPDSGLFSNDPVLEFTAPNDGLFYFGISAQGNGQYNPNLRPGDDRDRLDPRSNKTIPRPVERNYQVELTLVPPPAPYFFINDIRLPEGTSSPNAAVFTVYLSQPSNRPETVIISTSNGSAIAGLDYRPLAPYPLTFAPGQTSANVVVETIPDAILEPDETFFVNLSDPDPNNGAYVADPIGVGTILNDDDDPPPQFSISDVAVFEGTGGLNSAMFAVSMDRASAFTHTVSFATADGIVLPGQNPAMNGQDYIGQSGSLTFAPGETIRHFWVPIVADDIVELNENFFANLFNPTGGAGIAEPQGQGIIINDDSATVWINNATIFEGNNGIKTVDFNVMTSRPIDTNVVVNYQTSDSTATVADKDYLGWSGSVTFTPLTTTPQKISIPINGDTKVELNEEFFVNPLNIQANGRDVTLDRYPGIGTILNDDSATIAIDDVRIVEGNDGQKQAIFTVNLSQEVDRAVTVDWATAGDTAQADVDFASASSSITFAPGETTREIAVNINGDTVVEADEQFYVNLSNLQANDRDVTLGKSKGIGTIANDDSATVAIDDVRIVEGNDGQKQAIFTVNLSQEVDRAVTVDWATAGDTAQADVDFASASSSITFAPGETTREIAVNINGDTVVEADEQFFVNLSNLRTSNPNVSLGKSQGIGTIVNDDIATISLGDVTRLEGNSGTTAFEFVVSIDNPATEDITVLANTKGMTATGTGIDFEDLVDRVITIPAGSTSVKVTVPVVGETFAEGDETFEFILSDAKIGNVSDPNRVAIGDATGIGTIVNDDLFETDLSISKTDGLDKIKLCRSCDDPLSYTDDPLSYTDEPLSYTIEVANNGASTVTDIVVEDLFPGELTNVTWSGVGTPGASGYETTLQTGNFIDDGISLAPGAKIIYTVNATVDYFTSKGTVIKNTASIRSNNPLIIDIDPSNNQATDATLVDTCMRGTNGADLLVGTLADECIEGFDGDDTIAGGYGNDTIWGDDGDDILRGDLNSSKPGGTMGGDDIIYGGAGNDFIGGKGGNDKLFGGDGDDQIWGDDGDDILRGGFGNDLLTGDDFSGGQGRDTFVLATGEGTDTIVDFELGIDFIGLADGLSFGQLSFSGSDIKVGDEILATLQGVDTTALTPDRFVVV